jgi:hypothetical protein
MNQFYVPVLHIISQEVKLHLYVFGLGMEHCIFGNAYGTTAMT